MPINPYEYDAYQWNGRYVAFNFHAEMHCNEFGLNPLEVVDMLNDPYPCPQPRRHRKEDYEICSRKNRKIFRIIVSDDYCVEVGEPCWCVRNVKPA